MIPMWIDPPSARMAKMGAWEERLEPLKARPGEWALVQKTLSCHSIVSGLRVGKYKGVVATDWEFYACRVEGVGFIYAKYLFNPVPS